MDPLFVNELFHFRIGEDLAILIASLGAIRDRAELFVVVSAMHDQLRYAGPDLSDFVEIELLASIGNIPAVELEQVVEQRQLAIRES